MAVRINLWACAVRDFDEENYDNYRREFLVRFFIMTFTRESDFPSLDTDRYYRALQSTTEY